MELQPRLTGELIELRPLERGDFDALFAAASDPLIWEQHPEPDRHRLEVFERYFEGGLKCGGAFVVIDRATGRIIGSSRYDNMVEREGDSEIEIGWTFLERACWGGVYNREMKTLMVNHALRFVRRVVFVVGENNMRSQKALEKIGAVLVRRVPGETGDAGTGKVVFQITRALGAEAS